MHGWGYWAKKMFGPDWYADFEELAARMECDGDVPRDEAENAAFATIHEAREKDKRSSKIRWVKGADGKWIQSKKSESSMRDSRNSSQPTRQL